MLQTDPTLVLPEDFPEHSGDDKEGLPLMNTPLLMEHLFTYATTYYPRREVITRTAGGIQRFSYAQFGERTRRLSSALATLGVRRGDRVGTLAWNDHRHLEAYFGIPCMGSVLHTINIRLAPDQVAYIINHAEDRVLLVDSGLLPLLESIRDNIPTVRAVVIMGDHVDPAASPFQPAYSYEALLAESDPHFGYPTDLDENSPMGMCYTSATTGNPKGVLYSHRGLYLHSLLLGMANTAALSENDTVLPIVPMFHANAWGIPFAAVWFGANIVLPGPAPTPAILVDLFEKEHVTVAAGVPTVWLGVLQQLDANPRSLALRMVLCGGSAAPDSLIRAYEERHHIPFVHAYGMTETSPLATFSRLKTHQQSLSVDERLAIRATQGFLVPGLEMRLMSDHGEAAWNGEEMGELWLRGPWVADQYYQDERSQDTFMDGWLHTGDVATVDAEGFIRLVDRTKDLIKSGGEWISSVDLENAIMGHPAVLEAAVVGVAHPKWDERPLACVVLKPGQSVTPAELIGFLQPKFPKWWLPDAVVFLDEIPKTSVGKFMKRALRDQYRDYMPNQAEPNPS